MNKDPMLYRPSVGVVLMNEQGKVFVGQRIDNPTEAWQMPQGGIDKDEEPEQAALRELKEEIGCNRVEVLAGTSEWLFYDLPSDLQNKLWGGKFIGQRQLWFLARFMGSDSDINIATAKPEFSAWRWVEPQLLPKIIVPFKRDLYNRLLEIFNYYLQKS